MIIWIDAQLSPELASWLADRFAIEARHVRDFDLVGATDPLIFEAARRAGAVVVTKDRDFVDLVKLRGTPPQILWVRCGNTSNSAMMRLLATTFDEARRLLAAAAGDRLEAFYSVALAVGLRRGEALGLTWSDLDLQKGILTVRQALQRTGGKLKLSETKSASSRRTVPLPVFAIEALKRHRERQRTEREFAGDRWKESGLVFCTSIGTPMEPRNLTRHFHGILQVAKLPRRRLHDLRHTSASLLLAQGATLHEVKEILGHSQISLTANLYGHGYVEVMRSAVSRMDSVLAPPNPLAPSLAPSGTKPVVN